MDAILLPLTRATIEDLLGRPLGPSEGDVAARVARFVRDQRARMPDYLLVAMKALTFVFDLWPIPTTGRPFRHLSESEQARRVAAWKRSRLGPFRDFVRFHETLILFAWHVEMDAIGAARMAEP